MDRNLAAGLLVVGVVLVIWGLNASDSFSSEVSEAVTGSPSDKAMWLLGGGLLLGVAGLFGLLRGRRGAP
ncbi:MAG TPA: DUF3185 family protein [Planctomycetota bacterium]|nr:DUF3185 family protein [Planctomycetota bacterium]